MTHILQATFATLFRIAQDSVGYGVTNELETHIPFEGKRQGWYSLQKVVFAR